ncbi:CPBP family glutamic-type intramembrane protease [Siphonobacter sp. BAB-5385]|uniref:CPBP family glutamic-type intramembrane protease n=1 Tax=Siphonobacter sp. BAB-5385 TaxID=1864822 RepID=UPI00114039BB
MNWFIDIIVSSLLFGIAHSSTPIQFAKGFINGYFYANGYLKLKKIAVILLQGFL